MKSLIIYLFAAASLLVSCKKENDGLTTTDFKQEAKISSLDWLNDMANELTDCDCTISIFRGTYEGGIVFFPLMNDPLCNGIFGTVLYDSTGLVIRQYKANDQDAFSQEVHILDTLYTCREIPVCDVNDPLTELSWLAALKDELSTSDYPVAFVKAMYKKKIVFYYEYVCPSCNFVFDVTLYNCNGQVVRTYDRDDQEKFYNEVQFIEYL
jgi:hypothetical protein